MLTTVAPPKPLVRPAFAKWLWDRNIAFRDKQLLEALGGVSHEYVRRRCLPWSDPAHLPADPGFIEKVEALTDGEVTADSWTRPTHVRAREDVQ